jgi:LysR family glycine cleavage system transcriptional activator
VLTLSTPPSFAQKWLVPKLGRFREEFEKIELRVSTTDDFPDLMNSEIDVAIGFGLEHQFKDPAVVAELLLSDEVVPVCSPDFRNKHQLLSESELLDTELLHDDNLLSRQGIGWDTWFSQLGIRIRNAHENIKFDSTVLTIDAAMAGQGVALAPRSLVEHDLSSGRLVRPFERSIPMDSGYFVAHLEMISDRPAIIAFREWLFAEASINRELLTARLKAGQTSCILN